MIRSRAFPARGFTLIELLVVIAIIGLLASIVLASLSTSKDKANMANRLSAAKEIQNALELYYLKNNGTYPSTGGSNNWESDSCSSYAAPDWIPGLIADKDISSLPVDPDYAGGNTCCYMYTSDGTNYKLLIGYGPTAAAPSCTKINYSSQPNFYDPHRDLNGSDKITGTTICAQSGFDATHQPYDWAVYSPGASCW